VEGSSTVTGPIDFDGDLYGEPISDEVTMEIPLQRNWWGGRKKVARNVFEGNILPGGLPPEIEPYKNWPYSILPALEPEYDYKMIKLSNGDTAVVIDRKEHTDVHQAWASHSRDGQRSDQT
jgi:hypothetical protein